MFASFVVAIICITIVVFNIFNKNENTSDQISTDNNSQIESQEKTLPEVPDEMTIRKALYEGISDYIWYDRVIYNYEDTLYSGDVSDVDQMYAVRYKEYSTFSGLKKYLLTQFSDQITEELLTPTENFPFVVVDDRIYFPSIDKGAGESLVYNSLDIVHKDDYTLELTWNFDECYFGGEEPTPTGEIISYHYIYAFENGRWVFTSFEEPVGIIITDAYWDIQ